MYHTTCMPLRMTIYKPYFFCELVKTSSRVFLCGIEGVLASTYHGGLVMVSVHMTNLYCLQCHHYGRQNPPVLQLFPGLPSHRHYQEHSKPLVFLDQLKGREHARYCPATLFTVPSSVDIIFPLHILIHNSFVVPSFPRFHQEKYFSK